MQAGLPAETRRNDACPITKRKAKRSEPKAKAKKDERGMASVRGEDDVVPGRELCGKIGDEASPPPGYGLTHAEALVG